MGLKDQVLSSHGMGAGGYPYKKLEWQAPRSTQISSSFSPFQKVSAKPQKDYCTFEIMLKYKMTGNHTIIVICA